MPSIVIAAHNEESVIGGCLSALQDQVGRGEEIIVVANGCTDDTVTVAREFGVTVLDWPEPGKAGALNAGDAVADGYPRIYLDADIVVPPQGVEAIVSRLEAIPGVLAVVPRRHLNTSGRPWPVRAYVAINSRLPAFRTGLFGRGMIALSRTGRARFDKFPAMIADDLFLDSHFAESEKAEVPEVVVVVETPHTTRDLIRRLVRVRRGNAELRASAAAGGLDLAVRASDRWAWLREVVLPEPRLAPAAIPYLAITVLAALQARRSVGGTNQWGRDESTRAAPHPARAEQLHQEGTQASRRRGVKNP